MEKVLHGLKPTFPCQAIAARLNSLLKNGVVQGKHPSAAEALINLIEFSGTAKAVPFQNSGSRDFFSNLSSRVLLQGARANFFRRREEKQPQILRARATSG